MNSEVNVFFLCYCPSFTKLVTFSSIALSSSPVLQLACRLTRYCHTNIPFKSAIFSRPYSYLAYTLGSTPLASRIMMGMYGLFFFIVGYARVRNDLQSSTDEHLSEEYAVPRSLSECCPRRAERT